VDDTGARHKAANGFCTQIGNSHFTWFGTTASKSRLNFLALLRAGYDDYVVNAEALAYMRERALAAHVIARLVEHPDRCFVDQQAWTTHLERLGISALTVNPDPTLIPTEAALWGSVKAHGFLPETVIVSDDAGQFHVGHHALVVPAVAGDACHPLGGDPLDLDTPGRGGREDGGRSLAPKSFRVALPARIDLGVAALGRRIHARSPRHSRSDVAIVSGTAARAPIETPRLGCQGPRQATRPSHTFKPYVQATPGCSQPIGFGIARMPSQCWRNRNR